MSQDVLIKIKPQLLTSHGAVVPVSDWFRQRLYSLSLTVSLTLSISPPPYHSPSPLLPPFIAPSISLWPHLHFPNITKVKHYLVSFTFTPVAGGFLKLAGNGKGNSENIHFVSSFEISIKREWQNPLLWQLVYNESWMSSRGWSAYSQHDWYDRIKNIIFTYWIRLLWLVFTTLELWTTTSTVTVTHARLVREVGLQHDGYDYHEYDVQSPRQLWFILRWSCDSLWVCNICSPQHMLCVHHYLFIHIPQVLH